jgi:hypothetical protein
MNSYDEGTYQRGYHDYLRKCAQDKTTAEITQASSFYAGYKYAAQHAMRTLTRYIDSQHAYDQATVDILATIRNTLRKGIL